MSKAVIVDIATAPRRGLRRAGQAARALVPRARVAEVIEGVGEQLVNVQDLLACGRADEARRALADAAEDLREFRSLVGGDRNLVSVSVIADAVKDRGA